MVFIINFENIEFCIAELFNSNLSIKLHKLTSFLDYMSVAKQVKCLH